MTDSRGSSFIRKLHLHRVEARRGSAADLSKNETSANSIDKLAEIRGTAGGSLVRVQGLAGFKRFTP
jgi:hypothetical protein